MKEEFHMEKCAVLVPICHSGGIQVLRKVCTKSATISEDVNYRQNVLRKILQVKQIENNHQRRKNPIFFLFYQDGANRPVNQPIFSNNSNNAYNSKSLEKKI
ncbi:hypothetical protein KUTeg_009516 [Tegillarca granosa]|uniref:Uncharacterized protein n=1 Tax=Tegillarca granosa TaxID=220873 RepID=A0ABQ9F434_TEGGR|nr:hypothetical protein KUTeg_009516 [Tegillarca granosa]